MWTTIHPTSFTYAASVFAGLTTVVIYMNEKRREKVSTLFANKFFLVCLAGIVIWCYLTLNLPSDNPTNKKVKNATKHAIIALAIALLAELKLTIAPFWLVWIAAYYLDAG